MSSTATRDMETLLHETLRAKAAQLGATSDAPPLVAVLVDARSPRARGMRSALTIAAIVVVIALVAGLVISSRSRTSRHGTPTTVAPVDGSLTYPATSGAMAPSYVPDGLQLWSMQTRAWSYGDPFSATQLFGHLTADGAPDPGFLVQVQSSSPGSEVFPGATDVLSVHGQRTPVAPSKDDGVAPTQIEWIEDNVDVRVTIRGMDASEAAKILDAMRAKGSGLLDGFDPASAPADLPLLGEQTSTQTSANRVGTETLLAYGSEPPALGARPTVTVSANTARNYPGYLSSWLEGSGSGGGSSKYDPPFGYFISRPDGTSIVVNSPTLGEDELRRIAESLAAVDAARVTSLRAEVDRRLTDLAVVATADAGNGVTLELHGDATSPTTVCATRGRDHVCAPPLTSDPGPHGTTLGTYGSVVLDGQWFVFAASPDPVHITVGARPRPQDPVPDVAGLTTGTIGPWTFAAAVVPAGTAQVNVEVTTSGSTSGGELLVDPR